MTRGGAALLISAACAACSWQTTEPKSAGERGVPRSGAKDLSVAPAPAADEAPLVPVPTPVAETAVAAAPAEEKKRDYGAELLRAVGSPVDCLVPRSTSDAPAVLAIDIEAYVMPSGGVGRGVARSALLGEEELSCIRRRIEAIRLSPPIEEAPRRVSTTWRLELQKPGNPGG